MGFETDYLERKRNKNNLLCTFFSAVWKQIFLRHAYQRETLIKRRRKIISELSIKF